MNPEDAPLLDQELLLRRVGGKTEIVAQVYRDMTQSFPSRLTQCRDALQEGDMEALHQVAHALKGAAATAAAERTALLASNLSALSKDSTSSAESLERAVEQLETCVWNTLETIEGQINASTNPRILLVDDESVNLRVLRAVLEQAGYTNLVAIDDPHLVISEHQRQAADLVFLDLTMPDLDGYVVMKQLKEDAQQPPPAVIVLTGHTDRATIDHAKAAGASAFLAKPFEVDDLLSAIQEALGPVLPEKE